MIRSDISSYCMGHTVYEDTHQIWNTTIPSKGKVDLPEMVLSNRLQQRLLGFFQGGDCYYFVSDLRKAEYDYISPEITKVLGYDRGDININFMLTLIHPEDQAFIVHFENRVHEFLQTISTEKISRYKVQYDYRLKTKSGKYKRILHQSFFLQDETEWKFYRSIEVHTDITHIKPDGIPVLSIIGLDDEPSYFNLEPATELDELKSIFTKREKQILKFIVDGKKSEDISRILYISLHTVNTHRKKILQKAKAKSPTELATRAIMQGWV